MVGPTGPIMEFDRLGNARTLLFDPNGSNVSVSNGVVDYYFDTSSECSIFYDGYGSPVWPLSSVTGSYHVSPTLNRTTAQPFQYKGQYGCFSDGATGLDYCIHRYYDPLTGRWTSRDPSGLDGGVNVYGYVNGDPVSGADPATA